ncbi:hypothetical protein Hanom_Chr13g01205401 [Helianthus anomalus]
MTRSPLARRLSRYKRRDFMIESFGLASVLSPFNKEGVYVIPNPGDYAGSIYILIACCHPSIKRVCTCPKPGDHAVSV